MTSDSFSFIYIYIVEAWETETCVNLWKNTSAVVEWFHAIKEKNKHTFFLFHIVDFYPSISEQLLGLAVSFARTKTRIKDSDIKIIFRARKSLLFEGGKPGLRGKKALPSTLLWAAMMELRFVKRSGYV